SDRDRLLAMEGTRGVAVLLVFCVHYNALFQGYLASGSWPLAVSRYIGTAGHAGVDLFFVLSGFLIYGATIRHAPSFARFVRGWAGAGPVACRLALSAAVVASPAWIGGARSRMGMFIPGMLLYEAIESGVAARWVGARGERAALVIVLAGVGAAAALRPASGV